MSPYQPGMPPYSLTNPRPFDGSLGQQGQFTDPGMGPGTVASPMNRNPWGTITSPPLGTGGPLGLLRQMPGPGGDLMTLGGAPGLPNRGMGGTPRAFPQTQPMPPGYTPWAPPMGGTWNQPSAPPDFWMEQGKVPPDGGLSRPFVGMGMPPQQPVGAAPQTAEMGGMNPQAILGLLQMLQQFAQMFGKSPFASFQGIRG